MNSGPQALLDSHSVFAYTHTVTHTSVTSWETGSSRQSCLSFHTSPRATAVSSPAVIPHIYHTVPLFHTKQSCHRHICLHTSETRETSSCLKVTKLYDCTHGSEFVEETLKWLFAVCESSRGSKECIRCRVKPAGMAAAFRLSVTVMFIMCGQITVAKDT